MEDRFKHRMSSIRVRQAIDGSAYSPRQHEMPSVAVSMEQLISKLHATIDLQASRLKSVEAGMMELLSGKFDTLITLGVKLNDNITRLVDLTERGLAATTREKKLAQPPLNFQKPPHLENHIVRLSKVDEMTNLLLSSKNKDSRKSMFRIPFQRPLEGESNFAEKDHEADQANHHPLICLNKPKQEAIVIVSPSYLNEPESAVILQKELEWFSKATAGYTRELYNAPEIPRPQFTLRYSLKSLVGRYTTLLTDKMYAEYSQGKMLHNELRAKFSWEILSFMMGVGRSFRANSRERGIEMDKDCRAQLNTILDTSFREILEFLIKKYPPSKHKVVDSDMTKYIKDVRRQSELQYDILRNAGVSFANDSGKADFSKDIKIWMNKLIGEVKRVYPTFRNQIKDLFTGNETSLIDQDNEIEYDVGTKISEIVEMYTEAEINEPGLSIKSPQIQRVLSKWMEDLRNVMIQADKLIPQQKSGFKSTQGSEAIHLTTERKERLAGRILELLKNKVTPESQIRRKRLLWAISDVLTIVQLGSEGYDQLSQEQLICLKAAQYLDECSQVFLAGALNIILHNLNHIRKLYSPDSLESNVDLITFNILDILRCRCIGSKRDIKRIYDQLLASPDYEVIRVKNKLNESTRDILINFKPRDSFLVCEMQLALGDSKDEINDHFCHYLYELQRSVFPVAFEVASQIVSFDPRISYFQGRSHPVKFPRMERYLQIEKTLSFQEGNMHCSHRHPKGQFQFERNNVPYCCALCSRFVSVYHYMMEFIRCPECGLTICPKCIMELHPEMKPVYLGRYMNHRSMRAFIGPDQKVESAFGTEKQLLPLTTSVFRSNQYAMIYIFAKEGIKIYLAKLFEERIITTFFTIDGRVLEFSDGFKEVWSSVVAAPPTQHLLIEEVRGYAKLLIDDTPWHELQQLLEKRGIKSIIGARNQKKKQILVVDIPEQAEDIRAHLNQLIILKHLRTESSKAEATIELTSKGLTNLEVLRQIRNPSSVRSLNLWGNSLKTLPDMSAFTALTELVLRENLIVSITDAKLPSLQNIKLLNLQRNSLRGSLLELPLPHLEVLDISGNQLTDITSLSSYEYKHLQICNCSYNKLSSMPALKCPKLKFLEFINNQVQSLQAFAKSSLPKLGNLRGTNNKISGTLPHLDLPQLKYLHLADNAVSSIDLLATSRLPLMEGLILSKNSIGGALPILKWPGLKALHLDNNRISDIASAVNWELPSLEYMDLSNNSVGGRLPQLMLPHLKEARFSHNELVDVENLPLSKLNSLQKLSLASNMLMRLPVVSLFQLKELDLGQNCIEGIQALHGCRFPRLLKLDLSNNKIKDGVPEWYAPQLQEIVLDNNDLLSIDSLTGNRHLLPSLKLVSAGGNPRLASHSEKMALKPDEQFIFMKQPQLCVLRYDFTS